MANLQWIADPGVRFQAAIGRVHYYVMFPSIWTSLSNPSESFNEPDAFMVTAVKPIGQEGAAMSYVVAHGLRRDSDAENAAQADWDQYGEEVPPDKIPPPPPDIHPEIIPAHN